MTSAAGTSATPPAPPAPVERLDRRIVLLLAATAGTSVATLYYAQPLLGPIASDLGVTPATAGLLVAAAQLGYALGILLLVPVGDLVERRALLTRVLLGTSLASLACALSPTFAVLAVAILAAGVLAVVAQIAVPLASSLAAEHERGRVVGTVMSGLLIGIFVARTVSGAVAELAGWRAVFVLGALLLLVLAATLRRLLPLAPPTDTAPYGAALRSVGRLVREEPVLRQRMAIGACNMASFSVLWTSMVLLLEGPAYGYGEGVIGLFGIAGLAGVLAAPLAGRQADAGHGRLAMTLFLLVFLASWGLLALGESSLVALVAGVVLFDFGTQGTQISNQSAIYALRPEARSRLTTAYISSYFLGGVVGSALGVVVYDTGGWLACCAAGAALLATSLAVWGATQRVGR